MAGIRDEENPEPLLQSLAEPEVELVVEDPLLRSPGREAGKREMFVGDVSRIEKRLGA